MSEYAMLRCAACGSKQPIRPSASGSETESVLAPTLSVICVGCLNKVVEENERLRAERDEARNVIRRWRDMIPWLGTHRTCNCKACETLHMAVSDLR